MVLTSTRVPPPERTFTSFLRLVTLLAAIMVPGSALAETPVYQDWHTFVDEAEGIAFDLPPSHAAGSSDSAVWYIHGFLNGEPLVPDMSIQLVRARAGAGLEDVLGPNALDGALVEHVSLGRGVPARRITKEYETMDGRPYVSSMYLVPVTEGAYVIRRWENFDWEWFEHVALTFRFVK